MLGLTPLLIVGLIGSALIQSSYCLNADLERIFSVVEAFRCADGFLTVRQQGCIVRCINQTDPSDTVEPYVLHEKFSLKGCCTHTTYMNEDFECTVVDCRKPKSVHMLVSLDRARQSLGMRSTM